MTKPNTRAVALDVLQAVHNHQAYANLALPRTLRTLTLSAEDRGFITELVYGSLRREGELDVVIEQAAKRPIARIDSVTADILRLAVYQALFMRVAEHALVHEAVELAKKRRKSSVGFVNGVLRTVVGTSAETWRGLINSTPSLNHNHPLWVAQLVEEALADCEGAGDLATALAANNEAPAVTLALLPGFSEPTENDRKTLLSPVGVSLASGSPADDDRVQAGIARVQDEGSQLAALVLTRVQPIRPGERWLDMCAGPGGKAALMAAEALLGGAQVLAVEKQEHRADLVRQSVNAISTRNSSTVEVFCADSLAFPGEDQQFDRVLLDAPCSGLGALRRRPEARWRKSEDDLPQLIGLQTALLRRALGLVVPGGYVAYVTCSPVHSETASVIETVAKEHASEFFTVDTLPVLEGVAGTKIQGARRGTAVQLWPHLHHTDAMFIQLLRRRTG